MLFLAFRRDQIAADSALREKGGEGRREREEGEGRRKREGERGEKRGGRGEKKQRAEKG